MDRHHCLYKSVGKEMPLRHLKYSTDYNSVRGARGVMVILVGNGHGDTSSNPGRD